MIGFWNFIIVWLKVSPKSRDIEEALIAGIHHRGISSVYGHLQTDGPTRERDPLHGK
jgi:hypothetical protein